MRHLPIICAALGLMACDLNHFRRTPIDHPTSAKEFSVDTSAMVRTASGLRYQDVAVGAGATAEAGNEVAVAYSGRLMDGSPFDASKPGQPYVFVLGERAVIDGWDEGVAGMKVGGKRILVVPPALAYGAGGYPPVIPPNATLVFDVELMAVR